MEDIFDVVDSNDNVIASLPRSEVHARRLMHRASHVLIFADFPEGRKILLQKRSASKDLYPNRYTTSCSGHVDSGETYDIAAVRELSEETGLHVSIDALKYLFKIPPCPETGWEFTAVYEMFVPPTQKFEFPPDEVAALEWVSIPEFEKMIASTPEAITPSFITVYKKTVRTQCGRAYENFS